MAGVRLVQDVAYANDWAAMPEKAAGTVDKKMAYYDLDAQLAQMQQAVNEPPGGLARFADMVMANRMDPVAQAPQRARRAAPRAPQPIAAIEPNEWPAARDEEL